MEEGDDSRALTLRDIKARDSGGTGLEGAQTGPGAGAVAWCQEEGEVPSISPRRLPFTAEPELPSGSGAAAATPSTFGPTDSSSSSSSSSHPAAAAAVAGTAVPQQQRQLPQVLVGLPRVAEGCEAPRLGAGAEPPIPPTPPLPPPAAPPGRAYLLLQGQAQPLHREAGLPASEAPQPPPPSASASSQSPEAAARAAGGAQSAAPPLGVLASSFAAAVAAAVAAPPPPAPAPAQALPQLVAPTAAARRQCAASAATWESHTQHATRPALAAQQLPAGGPLAEAREGKDSGEANVFSVDKERRRHARRERQRQERLEVQHQRQEQALERQWHKQQRERERRGAGRAQEARPTAHQAWPPANPAKAMKRNRVRPSPVRERRACVAEQRLPHEGPRGALANGAAPGARI